MGKRLMGSRLIFSLLTAVLLISLIVTACASGGSPTTSQAPASNKASESPAKTDSSSAKTDSAAKPASETSSKPAAKSAPSVKVGAVLALSGPLATMGESAKRGLELANDYISANGGIKSMGGAKIELVYADYEGKPDLAIGQVERLAQEGVTALIGAHISAATVVSTQAAERLKIPHVVPLGVADVITERGFKYTFRPSIKSDWFIKDQVDFLPYLAKTRNINIKKVGLLYEDTEYGQSTATAWKKYLTQGKYEIVADLSYPAGAKDVSAIVSKMKAADPDIVLQTSYLADALLIAKTMDQLAFKKPVVGTGAGHIYDDFAKSPQGENSLAIALWNEDLANAKDVVKAFSAKYPNAAPNHDFAIFYQSMLVLGEALEKAGKADREAVREALAKLDFTGPMIMPYEKVQFGEDGQNKQEFTHNVVIQVQNGKRVTVWPEKYATGKLK